MEDIPLWSKKSLTQHARKVKETLMLLQQGKDEEAKVFVRNNTKQRNGKNMVTRMLQEHLQKIANLMLRQTPSQATEILEAKPQSSGTEEPMAPKKEEPTINHTEEIKGETLSSNAQSGRRNSTGGENTAGHNERHLSARQHRTGGGQSHLTHMGPRQ